MNASNRKDTDQHFVFPQVSIDHREIFRELIATEVKAGRMTSFRRARIVRFASQLGLSAVETGRLIMECQNLAQSQREHASGEPGLEMTECLEKAPAISPRAAIVTGVLLLTIWLLR